MLRVGVGYPEFQAVYHMPWDDDLEFAFGGAVAYGFNAKTAGDVLSVRVKGEGRWRIWKDGEHSIALTAAPALDIVGRPGFGLGFSPAIPGIIYDYAIKGQHHAILGMEVPWGLFVHGNGVTARIPILGKMGMEFSVTRGLHVFVVTEFGADIWAGRAEFGDKSYEDTYFYSSALFGTAFVL